MQNHLVDSMRYAFATRDLMELRRRLEAYQVALDLEQRRVRRLMSALLVSILVALAAVAFSLGVLFQWLA